jgi:hypothetical protein
MFSSFYKVYESVYDMVVGKKEKSFSERLAATGYDPDKIPRYLTCPFNHTLMDNPIILDGIEAHTLDENTLIIKLKEKPNINPFTQEPLQQTIINEAIEETIQENMGRKKYIELFVSCVENIYRYENAAKMLREKQIATIISIKNGSIKNATAHCDINPEQISAMEREQCLMAIYAILKNYDELHQELQAFNSYLSIFTLFGNDSEIKRQQEILDIMGDKQKLMVELSVFIKLTTKVILAKDVQAAIEKYRKKIQLIPELNEYIALIEPLFTKPKTNIQTFHNWAADKVSFFHLIHTTKRENDENKSIRQLRLSSIYE